MPTYDWSTPTVEDLYTDWDVMLQRRADSQVKMFDDGVTWTNLPVGAIKFSSTNHRWEKWNGSAFVNLDTVLTDVYAKSLLFSDIASGDKATARANLGLGTIAVENSPLPVNKGGTASTTTGAAQTALGLGTMCTQNASSVTITGGTLSGISSLQITSGNALSFVSSGTINNPTLITNTGDITFKTTTADYWLYFATNNINRFHISATGLRPYADASYDLGSAALQMRDVYTTRIITPTINYGGDIAVNISNTTYWVFGSGSKDFRPNTNNSQNLGHTSYYWYAGYITNVVASTINAPAGNAGITLNPSSTGNVQLYATGNIDFYAGGVIKWYIGSDGKLNPWAAAPDYNVAWSGWVITRRLPPSGSGAPSLTDVSNFVATIAADLVTLGLFS